MTIRLDPYPWLEAKGGRAETKTRNEERFSPREGYVQDPTYYFVNPGDWSESRLSLPTEDVAVWTVISDEHGTRNHAELRRSGSLWFLESGMYVYYTPTHWRTIS